MKNIKFSLLIISLFFGLFTSCSNDDSIPVMINEEEVITTLEVTLTHDTETVVLTSRDLDGEGPDEPIITVSGPLMANTVYMGSIQILNETVIPAANITEEVEDESLEHQLFYTFSDTLNASVSYTDEDADGYPVGLTFTLQTAAASTGTLTVTLRHEPNKDAAGVRAGDIANAGGESDVEQGFSLEIQ